MGKFEKPLTLILGLVFIIGLFIINCTCIEDENCNANGSFDFNRSNPNSSAKEITIEIKSNDVNLNVDSIIDTILEGAASDIDTAIEISVDLNEEQE